MIQARKPEDIEILENKILTVPRYHFIDYVLIIVEISGRNYLNQIDKI